MKQRQADWPQQSGKPRLAERDPDRRKCREQQSKVLKGELPGDRGMCEKSAGVQGSE
jgi:hypothetical protein